MLHKEEKTSFSRTIILLLVVASVLFIKLGFIQDERWYWGLLITLILSIILFITKCRKDIREEKEILDEHLKNRRQAKYAKRDRE